MSVPTHTKALDLAYIALMAALIALCAWISVPLGPVPFTMQTFGIFAALGLLGGRRGTLAFLIYLLLGIVGLPVFSGFSAGAGAGALLCLRHLLVSHRLHRRQRGDPAGRPDPVCVPLCSA